MARTPAKKKPGPPEHQASGRKTTHRLSEQAKEHITVAHACYRGPHAIVREVKDLFGEEITAQAVCHYNPELISSAPLAKKYKDLFNLARERFLEDIAARPLAHQAYRLSVLEQTIEIGLADIHAGGDNTYEAAEHVRKAIETAAKEVGGAFTNVKKGSLELSGSVAITPDERRNVLADKMREIIEGRFTELKPAKAIEKGK